MWTRKAAFGLTASALASKSANDMQRSSRLQSTNWTSAPGPDRRQRSGHEGVRRAEHRLALDAGEVERGERAPGPARGGYRRGIVPGLPGGLEAGDHVGLGPAVGIEHLIDEGVQTASIALIEADGEAREVGRALLVSRCRCHSFSCSCRWRGPCAGGGGRPCAGQTWSQRSNPTVPAQLQVRAPAGKRVRWVGRYRVSDRLARSLSGPERRPCVRGSSWRCRNPRRAGESPRRRRAPASPGRRSSAGW